jgi:hypothetical protein
MANGDIEFRASTQKLNAAIAADGRMPPASQAAAGKP